ncbi:hypothetical protein EDC01DRAFT_676785 [Geopyxis carbonaria]|nr:hypothetical protein EDC01DRAFT_676785 [Geopyxis carbonaria]
MKFTTSILTAVLSALAAAQSTSPGPQMLYAGPYKRAPALPASNTALTLSTAAGSSALVLTSASRADVPGFPYTVNPWPTGRIESTWYPDGAMALVPADPAQTSGTYYLEWADDGYGGVDGPAGTFTATGCDCGGNCGGFCVKVSDGATVLSGAWMVELTESVADGGWRVGWSNGTAGLPAGWQGVFLWRTQWVEPEASA